MILLAFAVKVVLAIAVCMAAAVVLSPIGFLAIIAKGRLARKNR